MSFHLLLRYGSILPIPHYKADAQYTKCSTATSPTTWTNCLYYPFYQRTDSETHLKTDKLRVDNLKDTIFVFFDKNVKLEDATVTKEIIQSKGKTAMENIGGISKLIGCLKQIPELANFLTGIN